MMLDTVTVKPRSSLNGYGEASFGTAYAVKCRIEEENQKVLTNEGQEVISPTHFWTDHVYGIRTIDQVTLPDGTIPDIITVQVWSDELGPSHEVVYVS